MGLRRGSALLACLLALVSPARATVARAADEPPAPGSWATGSGIPLAAPTSRLDSVSCVPGADYCLASGSHRGLVDEAYAEIWDGRTWSVAPPAPEPEAPALRDARMRVDCLANDFCVRGRDRWDGSTWSEFPGDPDPRIVAIECASTTWCLGVGYDPDDARGRWFVTGVWDGAAWTVKRSGGPDDRSTTWTDVECVGATFCLATRAWSGLGGQVTSLVRWDGAAWTLVDAWSGDARDLSCASATSCFVAGHRELPDSDEPPVPILRRWNGTTAPEVPLPVSDAASVSCWGGQRCLIVGKGAGQEAAAWNGGSWTPVQQGAIPAPDAGGSLGAVSCTVSGCVGVGRSTAPTGEPTSYSAVSDGYSWELVPTANPPGARIDALTRVSCGAGACTVLGRATALTGATDDFVSDLSGPWRARLPEGATYTDLACAGPGPRCVAVGHQQARGRPLPVAWHGADGTVLRGLPLPRRATSGSLSAVVCRDDGSCVAVGHWSGTVGRRSVGGALVVVYDGTRWRLGRAPHAAGIRDAQLTGVACPNADGCVVVGSGRVRGATRALVGSWRRSSWRLEAAPRAAGAAATRLAAVDCAAAARCVAVGRLRDGRVRPLVVTRSRAGWRTDRPPVTAGRLDAVACARVTACRAVGRAGAGPLSLSGRPGSWVVDRLSAPGPASDIACPDPTGCVAVGGAGIVLRGSFSD